MSERQITTLVFDWGNTIMVDDGQFSGKMMDWPSVQAIDGAYGTLKLLSTEYQLVLASNAEDSTTQDIYSAFEKVNLDSFFHKIFTHNELSAKKPDLLFYHTLVEKINCPVEKIVMIGDDYVKDIVGAKLAGWKAIWFNPSGLTSKGHLPLQDMEVRNFTEIPYVLSHPFLPDFQTCLGWYMASECGISQVPKNNPNGSKKRRIESIQGLTKAIGIVPLMSQVTHI
jgi:putative hydrolase of the HAD superfamily